MYLDEKLWIGVLACFTVPASIVFAGGPGGSRPPGRRLLDFPEPLLYRCEDVMIFQGVEGPQRRGFLPQDPCIQLPWTCEDGEGGASLDEK